MDKELQELLKLEFLNEDVQKSLSEAFTKKIEEAKQQARDDIQLQLKEQYSRRYAEAKAELVEATDRMVTTAVRKFLEDKQAEVVALKEERKKLSEAMKAQRADYKLKVSKHLDILENFILSAVKKEVTELAHDHRELIAERAALAEKMTVCEGDYQKQITEHTMKLEAFISKNLVREVKELHESHAELLVKKAELDETIQFTKADNKKKLQEAIATMKIEVMEALKAEKARLDEEKKALADKRVECVESLNEHREALNATYQDRVRKLEGFVVEQVTKELTEFETDKRRLDEERVRMHAESKQKLAETQAAFIARAAKLVEGTINTQLRKEMTVLKEDIAEARKNNFGRKLFEAYAMEFMTSFYSESNEVKKVETQLTEAKTTLATALEQMNRQQKLLEAATRKAKLAEEKATRTKVLGDMLSTLDKSKRSIMEGFLSTVKTENLKEQFNRYLPAVMSGAEQKKPVVVAAKAPSAVLTEHKAVVAEKKTIVEVTGNRENNRLAESVKTEEAQTNTADIINLRRLAGIE